MDRIEQLELSVSRMKKIMLGGAVLLIALTSLGAMQEFDTIAAKTVAVLDAKDHPAITMQVDKDGQPMLILTDPHEGAGKHPRVMITVTKDGSGVMAFYDHNDKKIGQYP